MAGKKWCQYCRINLPFDKKAIQDHESTRRHIQNKQKHIKYERIKIQREDKIKRQALKANSLMSTANIPKAKKGSQLQKQVQQYRNDILTSGKNAIHQFIAQKTRGLYGAPIQYPQKQDLVLAENYIDEKDQENGQQNENNDEKFQMWKIDICEQTGKACFVNRITKTVLYQPPKGYVLSQEQKQQWQETKKICDQDPGEQNQQIGQAGQWQVCEEQDYYQQNRIIQQAPKQQPKQQVLKYQIQENKQVKRQIQPQVKNKTWVNHLQQQIQNNQITQQQVIGTILTNTLQDCKTIKQKNEALKKLVKSDFQIKATLDQHDAQFLKQQQKQPKKSIGFKPRKKVKITNITQQKDIV